jgi:hypothetical protein
MKYLLFLLISVSYPAISDVYTDLSRQLYEQQQLQIQRQMLYEQQQYNRELQMQYNMEQSNRMFNGRGTYIAPETYGQAKARRAYREYLYNYLEILCQ